MNRKRIFEVIEKSEGNDRLSHCYDILMLVAIIVSLVPLGFKKDTPALTIIDKVCVTIFIIDYLLRWITADYKLKGNRKVSFIKYPFTPMAIIDLISILPSLSIINQGFKVLRVLRMIRALRVIRVFKTARYFKTFEIIGGVLRNSKDSLLAVGALAAGYIIISAMIIFNVEPDSFGSFFDAIYWATVSLTTVGYGDIYPVSTLGRIITMISSIFGIAIVALPAGIITAGYMTALKDKKQDNESNGDDSKQ
jgi:voltage-gated potassium channel